MVLLLVVMVGAVVLLLVVMVGCMSYDGCCVQGVFEVDLSTQSNMLNGCFS